MIDSLRAGVPSRRNLLEFGAGIATGGILVGCAANAAREDGEPAELFAGLADPRPPLAPISAGERALRRARLGRILAAHGLDALLIEPGATLRYLTDVRWGFSERLFALVVLADGSHFWVAPAFEVARARRQFEAQGGPGGDVLGWDEHEYPFVPLAAELRRRGTTRVGAEPWVRYRFVHELARALGQPSLPLAHDVVIELRARKEPRELELLRRANELTHLALEAVHASLSGPLSSAEVRARVRAAQTKLGLVDLWDLTLVGPASADPHGGSGDDRLDAGEVLLVDTGGALHGYQSDNTRTWVPFGEVPSDVLAAWNAVRDAQRRAFDAIRPGVRCRELDAIARQSLERAGFGPGYRTFTHRLGHGIGLEGHEDPYLDGGSEVVLAPGMTFSVEPGVYLPGRFGIRLENIAAVTEDGAEVFASWQQGPRSPA